jgi:hypothetical protein
MTVYTEHIVQFFIIGMTVLMVTVPENFGFSVPFSLAAL